MTKYRNMNRRKVLGMGAAAACLTALPRQAWADKPAMAAAIKDMFGDKAILDGRISLTMPVLSESGYFVPVDVEVDSPMTPDDYVRRVALFSERNPIALMALYNFTPYSGRARVEGKVRLGGSQTVHAIAEMSDGSLYGTSFKVHVTLAACVVN